MRGSQGNVGVHACGVAMKGAVIGCCNIRQDASSPNWPQGASTVLPGSLCGGMGGEGGKFAVVVQFIRVFESTAHRENPINWIRNSIACAST